MSEQRTKHKISDMQDEIISLKARIAVLELWIAQHPTIIYNIPYQTYPQPTWPYPMYSDPGWTQEWGQPGNLMISQ